jgi:Protein of unknown function (DUF1566)
MKKRRFLPQPFLSKILVETITSLSLGDKNNVSPVYIFEQSNDKGHSSEFIREPAQQGDVFDSKTNLTWQKIARCGDTGAYKWTKANIYCKSLKISGNANWRLPTMQELKDVLERKPTLSPNAECSNDSYWSSTLDEASEYAYLVPDDISRSSHKRRINEYGYTWCVHD